jgi:hypothetical protein
VPGTGGRMLSSGDTAYEGAFGAGDNKEKLKL